MSFNFYIKKPNLLSVFLQEYYKIFEVYPQTKYADIDSGSKREYIQSLQLVLFYSQPYYLPKLFKLKGK